MEHTQKKQTLLRTSHYEHSHAFSFNKAPLISAGLCSFKVYSLLKVMPAEVKGSDSSAAVPGLRWQLLVGGRSASEESHNKKQLWTILAQDTISPYKTCLVISLDHCSPNSRAIELCIQALCWCAFSYDEQKDKSNWLPEPSARKTEDSQAIVLSIN